MTELYAVQPVVTVADYASFGAFSSRISRVFDEVERRRRSGPAVVVFPEAVTTFLVLAGLPARALRKKTAARALACVAPRVLRSMVATRTLRPAHALFHARSAEIAELVDEVFGRGARRVQASVVAGSGLRSVDGRVWNASSTYGPGGRRLGVTMKVNLVPGLEDGLAAASEPGPILETSAGRLATAICYDGFRVPHTEREPRFVPLVPWLDARGAEVVAWPCANPWAWDEPWPLRPALVRRVQWEREGLRSFLGSLKSVRWVVCSMLRGAIFEHRFDGPSAILQRRGRSVATLALAEPGAVVIRAAVQEDSRRVV